ncbi:phosphoribosylglycinamide formyltransferase [Petrocella sp. FN5]|uniref:phosphoribosylglycinamide formyltransferase n=1 Tax=Petrocella sp. FN5 TaxID=3032002 RepID=UPI0023D97A9B|nr:phosphoribosylglycinamide formyltransferase [Petrocella sp. FN5]MDF1617049.1 phosphoribosylglycinamide formyltransferase [Petrocella sp. FN5]
MLKVGILVSGGGTNLQAIIDRIENQEIKNAKIVTVVSNRKKAYALERAKKHGLSTSWISPITYETREDFDQALINHFQALEVDLVVLAGYLVVLGSRFINAYRNRIINVHPSLLPAFSGDGFYGLRVHEAALDRGVKVSGATIHFVDEGTDTGPIVAQKTVEVLETDTPETLQKRIMEEAEWQLLPEVINQIARGQLEVIHGKVFQKKSV